MTNSYQSIEIEIGCGKGKFLLNRASENRQAFFVGIDKEKRWLKRGAERAERRRLENLKFIKGEAAQVLSLFPLECVSVFHIYFPDPWPKRHHHRRRLLSVDFFRLLHRHLKAKGLIEIATDDTDYFACIKKNIGEMNGAWKKIGETKNERPFPSSVRTNYEQKYHAEGKSLYYLELKK